MKSASSTQNPKSSQGQSTHSAGISNRPPAREEQEQRQLPPRGQAKKASHSRPHSGTSAKR